MTSLNKEDRIVDEFISTFLTRPKSGKCGERSIIYIKETIDRLLNTEFEITYDCYVESFRRNGFAIIEEPGITIDRKWNKIQAISIKLYIKEMKMLRLMTSGLSRTIGNTKKKELSKLIAKFNKFNIERNAQELFTTSNQSTD